ncbi:MAG: class I SAM-dependent methyltransferase [Candidatus Poseidoniaceae archaeon]|jgi:trans-aconitate methyltransferase|nr:class I SAM-dependent methyltransferase [Candidatus Poseidoniaceae archaeon]
MQPRPAVDVFHEWAQLGKDEGMERGHAASVGHMLDMILPKLPDGFSAIDLGCGNGWVVRKLKGLGAKNAQGIDGAPEMVSKAKSIDSVCQYHYGLLPEWKPEQKFDFVHSMEFLYYLKRPLEMLKSIHDEWLNDGGWLVAGVDHYLENPDSLNWPEHVGVHMTTLSIEQWKQGMIAAGFSKIKMTQVAGNDCFPGTLVMLGQV